MKEYQYFKFSEFDSPDEPGSGAKMEPVFLELLDKAREVANVPFKITSGFRTLEHNHRVGGSQNSSHLRGYAADIACNSSMQRYRILMALIKVGFKRIGIANGFIHVDCDPALPNEVIWRY
jgi:uncharacterized protein YcbK (DUF882 family)